MKVTRKSLVVFVLVLAVMSCSPLSQIAGKAIDQVAAGSGFTVAGSLWPDVPKMDGLTDDPNLDVPVYVRLYVQTALKAASGGEGGVDWIGFTTDKSPADIQAFYTLDRMRSQGWDTDSGIPCFSGSDQGVSDVGAICLFTKQESNNQTIVAIMAASDSSSNKTDVFFLRLTAQTTPTPAN